MTGCDGCALAAPPAAAPVSSATSPTARPGAPHRAGHHAPLTGSNPPRTVALVGPPNCGKSTLFTRLTGLRQKTANYPGVTVEQHTGKVRLPDGHEVLLVDLPGVYSLTPVSEDERVTHDALAGLVPSLPPPDAVLLILDVTNLGRHLVLAAPVLALGLPTLVVLNMADDLESRGGEIDTGALARQLGAPVALVSAATGRNVETVRRFLAGAVAVPAPRDLPALADVPKCRQWAARLGQEAGYTPPAPPVWTRRLDAVFLHPLAGPAVFVLVVVAVFQTIFTAARPLMDAIASAISWPPGTTFRMR